MKYGIVMNGCWNGICFAIFFVLCCILVEFCLIHFVTHRTRRRGSSEQFCVATASRDVTSCRTTLFTAYEEMVIKDRTQVQGSRVELHSILYKTLSSNHDVNKLGAWGQ